MAIAVAVLAVRRADDEAEVGGNERQHAWRQEAGDAGAEQRDDGVDHRRFASIITVIAFIAVTPRQSST